MHSTSPPTHDLESLCRGFLLNAAARANALAFAGPNFLTPAYRSGFAAGREAGEVSALALVLWMISGESAATLVEEALAHASVDAAVPFELHLEEVR